MTASALVSVIIPVYNAAGFIDRAIRSVQQQTHQNFEIILADDASTDNTLEVLHRLSAEDPRLHVIALEKNGGPSTARNAAIDTSTGEWIAILDSDDAWQPKRLEKLLSAAEATGADMIADNLLLYDHMADAIAARTDYCTAPMDVSFEQYVSKDIPGENLWPIGWTKPLIRADVLRRTGVRYRNAQRYAEDFLYVCELLLHRCKYALLPDAWYIYTIRWGLISKADSPLTRTVLPVSRGELSRQMSDFLCQTYSGTITETEKQILNRRTDAVFITERNNKAEIDAGVVINAIKRLRPDHALVALVYNPAVLPVIWNRLRGKLLRRTGS